MKKSWLRGLLLGLSLALFLAGGVALAQGIVITTDPEECLECSTGRVPNWLALYSSGWLDNETITFHAWWDGEYLGACMSCGQAVNGEYARAEFFAAYCPDGNDLAGQSQLDGAAFAEVDPSLAAGLGNWEFRLVGDTSGREGSFSFVVAEDCLAYEFVPEAGTIALLGSGLAGLAGYATLRLRSRP